MKKLRLMELVNAAAWALGLCLISSQAFAAVVCVGTGTIATSCSGVEYNGTTYNVTWTLPDYPTGPTPIFGISTPRTDSGVVTSAINSALTDGGFTNIEYATPTGTSTAGACVDVPSQPCFYVPYAVYASTVGTWESKYIAGTGWYTDPTVDFDVSTGAASGPSLYYWPFAEQNVRPVAVFTPAAVPVPAALPLFLSGIALVGWLGHRRRQDC
jgi:hypothetical protein